MIQSVLKYTHTTYLSGVKGCCPRKSDERGPIQKKEECGRTLRLWPCPCWFPNTHNISYQAYTLSSALMLNAVTGSCHFPLLPRGCQYFSLSLPLSHNKPVASPHCSRCKHRCNSRRAPTLLNPVPELDRVGGSCSSGLL